MPRILHLHMYVFNIGLVHPKGKLAHDLTHPQAILGVYDFLLSVILKKYPGSSKLYNGCEW